MLDFFMQTIAMLFKIITIFVVRNLLLPENCRLYLRPLWDLSHLPILVLEPKNQLGFNYNDFVIRLKKFFGFHTQDILG